MKPLFCLITTTTFLATLTMAPSVLARPLDDRQDADSLTGFVDDVEDPADESPEVQEARLRAANTGWKFNNDDDLFTKAFVGIGTKKPKAPLHVRAGTSGFGLIVPGLYVIVNEVSPNVVGGSRDNLMLDGIVGATIGGGGNANNINTVISSYGTVGGGEGNGALAQHSTVGGGLNNTAGFQRATVAGGFGNEAGGDASSVGGGVNNVASALATTIGGGDSNTASTQRATVAGGIGNDASGDASAIGGGVNNTASGTASTVGGGDTNLASGSRATVGGGLFNEATNQRATVSGGISNVAAGDASTVGGGSGNEALGLLSTIPGGDDCLTFGAYSFATGRRAKAGFNGSMVFADSTNADFFASGGDLFTVRCSGGASFYTSSDLSTGVAVFAGGGAWANLSDRETKENFEIIDSREILDKIVNMPITTWNYKKQDDAVRHIGPMAQDFHAAFSLGEDDKHITSTDADGVALAAIQGLHQIVRDQQREIESLRGERDSQIALLKDRLAETEETNADLLARIERLEAALAQR